MRFQTLRLIYSSLLSAVVLGVVATLPTAASAQTRLPFTSTFDQGNFNEWTGGFRNTTGVTIQSSGCQSGSCARAPIIGGTDNDNYGDYYFGDHSTVRGTKVEEVWLRFYSRFDSAGGWPTSGWETKLALLNLTDGQSSERRYQVFLIVNNQQQYVPVYSNISSWVFNHLQPNVGPRPVARLGQWDKLKMFVRLNTPGSSNGIIRLWVNDQLTVDYSNVNIRGGTAYGMNKLLLSSYSNTRNPGPQYQWWDSWTMSASDPDGGSTPVGPAAPTGVRILSQ